MLIAVPLTDRKFEENLRTCKEKGCDIVELRVDLFEKKGLDWVLRHVEKAQKMGLKTILTVRSEKEGGKKVENRTDIFESISPVSDYTDIELSSKEVIRAVKDIVKLSGKKLIVSYHNFELTPPCWVLKEIYREAKRFGADIVKIAVKANSYKDVKRLLCIDEDGDKVLIAMGELGKISRLAGFVFGSVITYSFLEEAIAPGQISLEEMVRLRDMFYGKG